MTEVRRGVLLTTQHEPGEDPQDVIDDHLLLARVARDRGWESAWAGQHILQTGLAGLQPNPFLGRLAAEVPDMTLGLCIQLLPLQNPVQAAEEVATLDVICGGKFVYGVGLGYRKIEYEAFGLDRAAAVDRLERNLAIVKGLLAGDKVSVDLPWCHLIDASLTMRGLQVPRPPIWVAADGDRAVKRAAMLGDAWLINPHASLPTIKRQWDIYMEARVEAGLSTNTPRPIVREVICCAQSQRARRLAQDFLGRKYKSYIGWGQDRALPVDERIFDAPIEQLAAERFLIGSPEECSDQLGQIVDAIGCDHLISRVNWPGMPISASLETMALLSEKVFPHFSAA